MNALEHALLKMPVVSDCYARRAAKLKRNFCLFLNRHGRLKPLSFVQWLATYQCDCGCPFCEASAGRPGENELTTDEVRFLIDDLRRMNVRRFVISGGEPLLRHDVIDLMRYANANRLVLGLVTNGFLVEESWDELRRLKYFCYFTSIVGMPEYHDSIMGRKQAFQRAVLGLELFRSIGTRMRIINTVVHPGNIAQLEPMLRIVKDTSCNAWHLTPTMRCGRASEGSFDLSGSQLKYLVRFVEQNRRTMRIDLGESHSYLGCFHGRTVGKPFFCGAGLTRCAIMPDGEVMGCQAAYNTALSEGNIRENLFSQIWRQGFTRFRREGLTEPCENCKFAAICQGGCWAEMQHQGRCLKSTWEEGR